MIRKYHNHKLQTTPWHREEETKSATMNIFRFFYFLFKSFVKVELSYVFTINLFTIAGKLHGKVNYLIKTGVLVIICVPPIIIDS